MRTVVVAALAVLIGGVGAGGFIAHQEGHLDRWLSGPVAGNIYENCGPFRKLEFRDDGRVVMRSSAGSEIYPYEVLSNSEVSIDTPLATLLMPVSPDGTLSVDSMTSRGGMRTATCHPVGAAVSADPSRRDRHQGNQGSRVSRPVVSDPKVETTLDQVQGIYERVQNLYASHSSYRGLSEELVVAAGLAPKGTVRGGRMVNEWEGGISVEGSAKFADRFSIILNSVPKNACVGILMSEGYERFNRYGLFSIAAVPMDFQERPSAKRANEVCSTFNSMRFTFDGVERGR